MNWLQQRISLRVHHTYDESSRLVGLTSTLDLFSCQISCDKTRLAHHHAHGDTSIDRIWTRISLSLGSLTHQLTHKHIKFVESTDRATDRFP